MEDREIMEYWGEGNLFRWKEDDIKDSAVPQSAKKFLITVGLPCNETWSMKFDNTVSKLPRLARKTHLCQIGWDYEVPLCIDATNGIVVAAECDIGGDVRFINSNVKLFGECLVYYGKYRKKIQTTPDDNLEGAIKLVEEQVKKSDPRAFSNKENWWPVIIEQMHQGFL